MNALNNAADAVEARRGELPATTNYQGKRTHRRLPRNFPRFRFPSKRHSRTPDPTPRPASTTPTDQLDPWEADLRAFFRVRQVRVKDCLEREKAQKFADRLDLVLDDSGLPKRKRTQFLRYLRKLCGTFGILPSSFVLAPIFVQRADTPFAAGGTSEVYKASLNDRVVVIKTLTGTTMANPEKVHRLLVKEVVGWKWLQHENILPFVGVIFTPPISIVSEQMENGNIIDFIKAHQKYNRLRLLIGAVTGLEFLHEHDIVHGDLKGVNILIDSQCRARLADFGLAVVVDALTGRSTSSGAEIRGTTRWMAPEIMHPEEFGFTGESLKLVPSKSTDIYAAGMTILEVLTGCRPFNNIARDVTVIHKVIRGDRPKRPRPGFSDKLWRLLLETWAAEYIRRPQRRPPASTILKRLGESVDQWEKSIVPLVPEQWQESENRHAEVVEVPNSSHRDSAISLFHSPRGNNDKIIQCRPILAGIINKLKKFLRLSRDAQ
ncbi:kinase-like protein [Thelephora ganbajun]|uniref:Kinase-like protein n=1 Tax=Thelephora ganbajun TaxID=370292 RepID=A0ACB6ZFE4_THEGA|nr:kinase-like protein [Thelephora ganbajun]